MRFLIVGDVCGRPGRAAFAKYTPQLRAEKKIDVVIVNGENSAGGKGITRKSLDGLYHGGADIITSGNHIWDKKDVLGLIDDEPFLIRPANYPRSWQGVLYLSFPGKEYRCDEFVGESFYAGAGLSVSESRGSAAGDEGCL